MFPWSIFTGVSDFTGNVEVNENSLSANNFDNLTLGDFDINLDFLDKANDDFDFQHLKCG